MEVNQIGNFYEGEFSHEENFSKTYQLAGGCFPSLTLLFSI